MGHERVGFLPKSKRWRDIVGGIAQTNTGGLSVLGLADQTLTALGRRYADLASDPSVQEAFQFLTELAVGAREREAELTRTTPLQLTVELTRRLAELEGSAETRELVRRATGDALAAWARDNEPVQVSLFTSEGTSQKWLALGDASHFSQLARLYFSKITERYLRYFLDREASASLGDLNSRQRFQGLLASQLDEISRHAFESAKITQSFAAGWFNKNSKGYRPSRAATRRFLDYAFAKMREEIRREAKA